MLGSKRTELLPKAVAPSARVRIGDRLSHTELLDCMLPSRPVRTARQQLVIDPPSLSLRDPDEEIKDGSRFLRKFFRESIASAGRCSSFLPSLVTEGRAGSRNTGKRR